MNHTSFPLKAREKVKEYMQEGLNGVDVDLMITVTDIRCPWFGRSKAQINIQYVDDEGDVVVDGGTHWLAIDDGVSLDDIPLTAILDISIS